MPLPPVESGTSRNVLLVGEESAGIQTLRLLAQSPHRVVGVLASPARQAHGGATVWHLAQQLGYRTWPAEKVKDAAFAEVLRAEQVDLLLNVHSLFIIAPEVIAAPRYGSYNLHPGPLPRYAGLNAVSWALYRGETAHGVTLHKMEPEIDTGPLVFQTLFPLTERDTALTVYTKCIRAGVALLQRLLETAAHTPAAIPLTPQDLSQREYFGKHVPENGCVRWERPARELYNWVRACDYFPFPSPWGQPRARLGAHEVRLSKVRLSQLACRATPGTIGQCSERGVAVACADEWLWCEKIIFDGRSINAAAVLQNQHRG